MHVRTVMIDGVPHAITFSSDLLRIEPRTGVALTVNKGEELLIKDPVGEQVAMLTAFMVHDTTEWLSGQHTIAQLNRMYLQVGDALHSSASTPMLTILEDTVGRHDILLPPGASGLSEQAEDGETCARSCLEVLDDNLRSFGSGSHAILSSFNIFLNVRKDPRSHALSIGVSRSLPGDHIVLRAEHDIVVGIVAAGALESRSTPPTPIDFTVRSAQASETA